MKQKIIGVNRVISGLLVLFENNLKDSVGTAWNTGEGCIRYSLNFTLF